MKARLPGTSPKLTQKEYNKIYTDAANDTARSVIAAVLIVLHRRKWHKDKIQQFYTDVIATMDMPPVFGKELTDIEARMYLSERYGIDFRKIHRRSVLVQARFCCRRNG